MMNFKLRLLIIFLLSVVFVQTINAQSDRMLIVNDSEFNVEDTERQLGDEAIVYATAIQSDGKILTGGNFGIVRYNTDRTTDRSFDIGSGFSGQNLIEVRSISIQLDGKILVGGLFRGFNGSLAKGLIRLQPNGQIDNEFQAHVGEESAVMSIFLQTDGKILVGGSFSLFNSISSGRIIRLNGDGSIDNTFITGNGFDATVLTIMTQPDGKILAGGRFTAYNGTPVNQLVRLNSDGSRDETFNSQLIVNNSVRSITLQTDGKIVVGGRFARNIARLNMDGSIDSSFDPGMGFSPNWVAGVALQDDGKIVVGGYFSQFNGALCNKIARLNQDGSFDSSFGIGEGFSEGPWTGNVERLVVLPNRKILAAGGFHEYNTKRGVDNMAVLNLNGELDETFTVKSGFNSRVSSLAIQSDQKVLVGGVFTSFNNTSANRIARLNTDGSKDNSFAVGTGFDGRVHSLAVQPNNKILVVGNFSSYDGVSSRAIVRLNPDGNIDNTFDVNSGFDHGANWVVLQTDGKIIVGGHFTSYKGRPANRIIRLNDDGSVDESFAIGLGFEDGVYPSSVSLIDVQPDQKILVAGTFSSYNGSPVSRLVRLNPDGSIDSEFRNEISGGSVFAIGLQSDGKILVGGNVTGFFIRLNSDGTKDADFLSGQNGTVTEFEVLPDDKILIQKNSNLCRLNPNGDLDETFTLEEPLTNGINAIIIQPDGKILIGGSLTAYGDIPRNYLARLKSIPDRRNKIQGTVFYDDNGNDVQDDGERGISNVLVKLQPGNRFYPTDANGDYAVFVGRGDFTVEPVAPMYTASITPASHLISFTSDVNIAEEKNFGVELREAKDMSVALNAITRARPGFELQYNLSYKNRGTILETGTVNVSLDPTIQFISSTPAPTSITGNTLTFAYNMLERGSSASVLLNMRVPADVGLLGRELSSTASIDATDDLYAINNESTVKQTVVGSYDPNDISVSPEGYGSERFIPQTTDRLYYRIRFQNMGTDVAENISVKNVLDQNLDVSSFEMVSSSHSNTFMIEEGEVTWQFSNIYLPHQSADDAGSNGYIIYSISPRTGIAENSIIQNSADIYFDYNPAVLTNTVLNTIKNPPYEVVLGVSEEEASTTLYPNPFKEKIALDFTTNFNERVVIDIRDMSGRKVYSERINITAGKNRWEWRTSVKGGVYILTVSGREFQIKRKVIKLD